MKCAKARAVFRISQVADRSNDQKDEFVGREATSLSHSPFTYFVIGNSALP